MDNAAEDAARSTYFRKTDRFNITHVLRVFAPKTCFFCGKKYSRRTAENQFAKKFLQFFKDLPPGRLITLCFASVILLGTLLLLLPISVKPGIEVGSVDQR